MKATPKGWPRLSTAVYYDDAAGAIDWLCRAFGFKVRLKVEGDGGRIEHSELVYGEGLIMVGEAERQEKAPYRRSPRAAGGINTQNLDGVRGRRRRALRAGARLRLTDRVRTRWFYQRLHGPKGSR